MSAEAINEQTTMVSQAFDMLKELQSSVIAMRKAKGQAKSATDANADHEELKAAGDAAVKAIEDWEKGLINTERQFFQDVLNWPDKLHSDLQFIVGNLNGGIPPVNAGTKQRFEDVAVVFREAMTARDAVVSGEIAAFNTAFAESGRSPVAAPDFSGE